VLEFIKTSKWHFAKSMPNIPHSYVRRRETADFEVYKNVVQYIRENGQPQKFYSRTYIYLELDGYKYWSMGAPVEDTDIINRAKINDEH